MVSIMEDNKIELEDEFQCDCEECNKEEELYTQEDIVQLLDEVLPKVVCNTNDLQDFQLNGKMFQKGANSVSEICGQYSALTNVGIDKSSAIDIIMNIQNIEFNKIVNTENCNSNKETAKLQNIQVQSQQI